MQTYCLTSNLLYTVVRVNENIMIVENVFPEHYAEMLVVWENSVRQVV